MPIISYIGATSGSANNPTSGSWDLPAGWSNNDAAIFCIFSTDSTKVLKENSGGAITAIGSGSLSGSYILGYRRLQTGDVGFSWSGSDDSNSTTMWGTVVFRSISTNSVFNTSSIPRAFANTNDPQSMAVTTTQSGSCVLSFFGKTNDYTSVDPPSGYLYGVAHSSTTGNDASMGIAYKILAGAAAETPGAWTLGGGAAGDDGYTWTGALLTGSFTLTTFKPFVKGDGFSYLYVASGASGKGGGTEGAGRD